MSMIQPYVGNFRGDVQSTKEYKKYNQNSQRGHSRKFQRSVHNSTRTVTYNVEDYKWIFFRR